jgi:hypothetical protein
MNISLQIEEGFCQLLAYLYLKVRALGEGAMSGNIFVEADGEAASSLHAGVGDEHVETKDARSVRLLRRARLGSHTLVLFLLFILVVFFISMYAFLFETTLSGWGRRRICGRVRCASPCLLSPFSMFLFVCHTTRLIRWL